MRIEDFKIGMVVYNKDNEKLTVEVISAAKNCEQGVYTRDAARFGKWYKPNELQEKPIEWVDLGLPSGTLWKADIERNEKGEPIYLTYDEAKAAFKDNLPKSWQFTELKEECEWKWDKDKKGYEIIGPNGNKLFLPAVGNKPNASGSLTNGFSSGFYWSAVPFIANTSRSLLFNSSNVFPRNVNNRTDSLNIILCKTK